MLNIPLVPVIVSLVLQLTDLPGEGVEEVAGDVGPQVGGRGVLQGGGEGGEERPVLTAGLTATVKPVLLALLLALHPAGLVEGLGVDVGDLLARLDGPGGHHDDLPPCRAPDRVWPAGVVDESHGGPDCQADLLGLQETPSPGESLAHLVGVEGGHSSHVDGQQGEVDVLLGQISGLLQSVVQPATVGQAVEDEDPQRDLPHLAQQVGLPVADELHQPLVVGGEVGRLLLGLPRLPRPVQSSGELGSVAPEELLGLLSEEPEYEEEGGAGLLVLTSLRLEPGQVRESQAALVAVVGGESG